MSFIRDVSKALPVCILAAGSLLFAASASAAIQQHTFSISGNNGETGSGSFTWDDSVVPNGSALANDGSMSLPAEVLTISINISGGNTVGGSATFTRADCTGAYLQNTPNFTSDINFWCNNGTNILVGVDPYTNLLNGGPSVLTFTPGATAPVTPTSVPTLSEWGMILLSSLLALGTIFTLRRKRQ